MEGVSIIFIFVAYVGIRLLLGHHRTPIMLDRKRYKAIMAQVRGKEYALALPALEKILQTKPESALCWALKAECHLHLREFHQAILYADKALNIDYNLPETYYHKALACLHLGNLEGAMEELNKTIWYSREQHSEAFYHKGKLLLRENETEKAEYVFEKAVKLGHERANYALMRLRNDAMSQK